MARLNKEFVLFILALGLANLVSCQSTTQNITQNTIQNSTSITIQNTTQTVKFSATATPLQVSQGKPSTSLLAAQGINSSSSSIPFGSNYTVTATSLLGNSILLSTYSIVSPIVPSITGASMSSQENNGTTTSLSFMAKNTIGVEPSKSSQPSTNRTTSLSSSIMPQPTSPSTFVTPTTSKIPILQFRQCHSNTEYCNKHGKCFVDEKNAKSIYCACGKDYFGEKCKMNGSKLQTTVYVLIATTVILALAFIILLVWHCCKCGKRNVSPGMELGNYNDKEILRAHGQPNTGFSK